MDPRRRTITFGAAGAVLGLLVGIGVGLVAFGGDDAGAGDDTLAPLVTSAPSSSAVVTPSTTTTEAPLAVAPSESTTVAPSVSTTSTLATLDPTACASYVERSIFPLRKCDSGEAVRELQMALQAAGYDVVPDGFFGPGTQSIVAEYQRGSGRRVDGVVDQDLYDELTESFVDY